MIESRWFDPFILFTIIFNVVAMAMESPLDSLGTVKADVIAVRDIPLPIIPASHPEHSV